MERHTKVPTVGEALDQWDEDYKATFSASFAQVAALTIRLHLKPAFGQARISDLGEHHLLQFVRAKAERLGTAGDES